MRLLNVPKGIDEEIRKAILQIHKFYSNKTNPVSTWDLEESSGTRYDSSVLGIKNDIDRR